MNTEESIYIDLPANLSYLSIISHALGEVLRYIEDLPDAEYTVYNLQLAVHEACTNIVEHAYANQPTGRIRTTITLNHTPRRLVVELHDTGQSFDITAVTVPDLDTPQEGGYGLFLIHSLMDEVSYLPQPDNNCWRLVKHLP
jgi:serine/threonine-protein kinase RsbW